MKYLAISLICVIALSGCNTFRGVGRDLESLGGGIHNTARDAKDEIRNVTGQPAPPPAPHQQPRAPQQPNYQHNSPYSDY